MEEYQKIVNPLTRDEISPSMERNIWESKSRDQGGFEPQLVSQDIQFDLFAGWKAQIERLAKSYPPKSFSKGELAMLLSIAGTGRKCWNRSHLGLLVLAHNTKWGVRCPRLGLILSVPFPVQSVWVNVRLRDSKHEGRFLGWRRVTSLSFGQIYSEISHEQWWFSIVMLVYQRVPSTVYSEKSELLALNWGSSCDFTPRWESGELWRQIRYHRPN